jgi:hypothetical protein
MSLDLGGAKVAFCWCGNPAFAEDEGRSLTLAEARMFEGAAPLVLVQVSGEAPFECPRLHGTDMAVTASMLAQLELVVTVDTSIANLAGAIGKECWVIAPRYGGWRWGAEGKQTRWYDSVEVFRWENDSRSVPIESILKRLKVRFGTGLNGVPVKAK